MHLPKKCFCGDSVKDVSGFVQGDVVEIYKVSRNNFKGFYKKAR